MCWPCEYECCGSQEDEGCGCEDCDEPMCWSADFYTDKYGGDTDAVGAAFVGGTGRRPVRLLDKNGPRGARSLPIHGGA